MYTEPTILPLDINGEIYVIHDEKGNTLGTGTREVCELLVHIMKRNDCTAKSADLRTKNPVRTNVRAAIVI